MASDQQTAQVVLSTTLTLIGSAHWRLRYEDWLAKMDATDDEYWREKWHDWQELAKACSSWDAYTLAQIVS